MSKKDILRKTRWKEIANSSNSYIELSSSLQKLAQEYTNGGESSEAEVVGLLATACSMLISKRKSISEPFLPFSTFKGRHSASLKYFENEEILEFFRDIFPLLEKFPLIRARVGDVLWILDRPKDIKYAHGAIDAYASLPIEQDSWYGNNDESWQRVITLTKRLGNGGKENLGRIEKTIYLAFMQASKKHRRFAQRLSCLLLNEGFSENHADEIAKILYRHARQFNKEKEFHWAQEGFLQASEWFAKAGKNSDSIKAEAAVADSLVFEAQFRRESGPSGIFVSGELYGRALQFYRKIPAAMRGNLRINKKITETTLARESANGQALGLMRPYEIEAIDYRKMHVLAKNVVQDENPVNCLRNLSRLNSGFDIDSFNREIEQSERGFFSSLFSSVQMTDTGQIAAKAPGIGHDPIDKDSQQYKDWLSFKLNRRYQIMINLQVSGIIMPALWEMHDNKRLTERFFVHLAYWSPVIPNGREHLVGRALHCGYELDFSTAIHLLCPQLENLVRAHLKNSHVSTRHTDINGIDTEKGLSSLIDNNAPEFEQIFGRNICAEIRMLFCEGAGPNLRNNVAHGLLDDYSSESLPSVYAWWFFLKLLFTSFPVKTADARQQEDTK